MQNADQMRADALRTAHRASRAGLTADVQRENAQALTERIAALPVFRNAVKVAAYIAIRGEIDLEPLLQIAARENKSIYLPVLRGEAMRFAPWSPGSPLEKRAMGLLEPVHTDSDWIDPTALDLVLAPLVVFDSRCQRIGQGGGYYDRTFAFRRNSEVLEPTLLGVAHDSQREPELKPMPWDVPLDMIATNSTLYPAEDNANS